MYFPSLNWCLALCSILGVPPNKNNIIRKFQYFINLFCILTISFLTMYMIYVENNFNIQYIGEVSTPLSTFPHALLKLTTLFVRKREIYDLLEKTRVKFWKIEETPEIKRILRIGKLMRNIFWSSLIFFIVTNVTKPFLTGDVTYKCHEPEWLPKLMLIILQDYTCCVVLLSFCAFDTLMQTILIMTTIQFMMLNKKLKNIFTFEKDQEKNSTEVFKRIKECVEHHMFLIDFVERFKASFSTTFLLYVGNVIVSLCLRVYIIVSQTSKLGGKIEAVIHTFAGLNEICLCYSIPAQLFMDQADEISNNVYFSNWYDHPEHAKDMLLIMIRDQRQMIITAGGFVMIDLKMFMVACKTIISYSMFLNTMAQLQ